MKTLHQSSLFPTVGWYFLLLASLALVVVGVHVPQSVTADTTLTEIYFVRHAEINKKDPDKPLNDKGKQRANALAERFADTKLTSIYASHTDRTRDTVVPLAKTHNLSVKQFPAPGRIIEGKPVTNRTSGKHAIKPLITALKSVPAGSTVVVAGNSGNLFAVMAGIGVRVATEDKPCGANEDSCLPCAKKSCFPKKEFDNIWVVTPHIKAPGISTFKQEKYGAAPQK